MKRFPRHPFRKKESARRVYLLPNLFTTGNILCGVMSVMYTLEGRFTAAAYMIILGFIFDILDGRIARLTNTGSVFGVNYDSLSDLMTFGLAPAALVFGYFLPHKDKFLLPAVAIYAVCTALRLARFNVQASTTEKKGFKGLPCPAPAAFVASIFLCFFLNDEPPLALEPKFAGLLMQALLLVLSGLMVSDIPYPVLGAGVFRQRHPFHYLVILLITFMFIIANPPLTLLMGYSIYIVYGVGRFLLKPAHPTPDLSEQSSRRPE